MAAGDLTAPEVHSGAISARNLRLDGMTNTMYGLQQAEETV